jgi:predicted glycoside hydrolase/deacetylase ChbG (UPF0249 family)
VNADDFGLTSGINRAVAELHAAGVLTSCTLMANAAATQEAIEIALRTPSLGVGCHIVLVDGKPVLPPGRIPSLVDSRTGRFLPTLSMFLVRLMADSIRPSEVEAEATAQMERLQASGVTLTHFDTHKHTHMFPTILKPLLRAAGARGVCRVRNPFEPGWSLRATARAPLLRRAQVRLLRRLLPKFHDAVYAEGFKTTNGAIGVLATGTLNTNAISSLLWKVPEGTYELVTHPGYYDGDLVSAGTRLLESREVERSALLALGRFPVIRLTSFDHLGDPEKA